MALACGARDCISGAADGQGEAMLRGVEKVRDGGITYGRISVCIDTGCCRRIKTFEGNIVVFVRKQLSSSGVFRC